MNKGGHRYLGMHYKYADEAQAGSDHWNWNPTVVPSDDDHKVEEPGVCLEMMSNDKQFSDECVDLMATVEERGGHAHSCITGRWFDLYANAWADTLKCTAFWDAASYTSTAPNSSSFVENDAFYKDCFRRAPKGFVPDRSRGVCVLPGRGCYEADLRTVPGTCVGYEKAGYVCSGPFCAANNPSSEPVCAKKGPAGSVANSYTGKCEVYSHVGEILHGFGVLPSSQSLCNRDARRPPIILVPGPDYASAHATGGAPIRLAAPEAMLFDVAVHGFPSDGVRVAEQSHLGGLEVRSNSGSGIHFEPAASGSTLQAGRHPDPSVSRYLEGAAELAHECAVTEQQRSVVVANQLHGIYADVDGVQLSSAFIGLEVNGVTSRGNERHGIYIPLDSDGAYSAAASVGSWEYDASRLEGLRVVIANNKGNGIRSCGRVDVRNTFVGVEADGVSKAGNGLSFTDTAESKAIGFPGIQIGCGDEPFDPDKDYGKDVDSAIGTLSLGNPDLESICTIAGHSDVVVAANWGSGIKINKPIGNVKISNTNVGVGSNGVALAGNYAHGIEIVNNTYTQNCTACTNCNHEVHVHNSVVVASRNNGIDARGKVNITCSHIGVLRDCIAKSGQFLEVNEHAGNMEFGLELHDYLDAGSYGKVERSEVTGSTFVNNKLGGIFSKAKLGIKTTFIGEDACGNVHLTPQPYSIMIPIKQSALTKLNMTSTEQWNGEIEIGSASYATSISAAAVSVIMAYIVPGTELLLSCGQIDSQKGAREYQQNLVGAFCCLYSSALPGVTPLDDYLQQTNGAFSDLEARAMFSAAMFTMKPFNSSALDWFYDGWKLNLSSSYDGINAGKMLLAGSWQMFTATKISTAPTAPTAPTASTPIAISDDTALLSDARGASAATKVVAGVVTSLLLLVGAGLAAVFLRRRQRTTNAAHAKVFREVADAAKSQFARNYRHLRKQAATPDADSVDGMVLSPKSVSKMHQIGEGRRSVVYAGHMDVVGSVAIKELRTTSVAESALQLGGGQCRHGGRVALSGGGFAVAELEPSKLRPSCRHCGVAKAVYHCDAALRQRQLKALFASVPPGVGLPSGSLNSRKLDADCSQSDCRNGVPLVQEHCPPRIGGAQRDGWRHHRRHQAEPVRAEQGRLPFGRVRLNGAGCSIKRSAAL